jgi:peroxiredoxin family protein
MESIMESEIKGLGIIFHSGSYARLYHGLSIALAALALGRKVRFFFTFWALEYLKRAGASSLKKKMPEEEDSAHIQMIQENIKKGHLESFSELIDKAKALGGELYTCTNSMSLLNIARDELIEEVDRPMGLTTFLKETAEDQILFI